MKVRHDLEARWVNADLHIELGRGARLTKAEEDWTRGRHDDPRCAPGQLRMRRLVEAAGHTDTVGAILPDLSLERSIERVERKFPAVLLDDRVK